MKQVGDWISKRDAMEFLNYKTTQMNQFLKDYSHEFKNRTNWSKGIYHFKQLNTSN